MTDDINVTREGAVLLITIDRPHRRNAINQMTARAISSAMDRLDATPELVVGIITGAGGTFCAGMDLKAFLDGERPEVEGRGFAGVTEAPPRKPLIAAVEGHALAGGCELVLACDLVVAATDAEFGLPEVRRGLVAGSGGLVRLPQRIPRAIAMEYALTGRGMSAEVAHAWGFVNRLTEPGSALHGARELADEIVSNGPLAVQASKQIMVDATTWPVDEVWERQRSLVEHVLASDDAREGARAFAEKRTPVWRGR